MKILSHASSIKEKRRWPARDPWVECSHLTWLCNLLANFEIGSANSSSQCWDFPNDVQFQRVAKKEFFLIFGLSLVALPVASPSKSCNFFQRPGFNNLKSCEHLSDLSTVISFLDFLCNLQSLPGNVDSFLYSHFVWRLPLQLWESFSHSQNLT